MEDKFDLRQVLEEIDRLDKEKARIEWEKAQFDKKKAELTATMIELGVTPETLSEEISKLQKDIAFRVGVARSGLPKPATEPAKVAVTSPAPTAYDDLA